jgi:hypothetical protein
LADGAFTAPQKNVTERRCGPSSPWNESLEYTQVTGFNPIMPRDKTQIALSVLIGLIIVSGAVTLAYRYYYYDGADEREKFLCDDKAVAMGKYGECVRHYKQPSR